MSLEQAYQEIEKIKKELELRVNELSKAKPFLNDTLHDIIEISNKIRDEMNRLQTMRKEIDRKLSSKEFNFIEENFNITKEDLDPNKYKSYDELSYILKIRTYHAYNWDSFLEPWIRYYESFDKIKLYFKEFINKIKIINFYVKIVPFSMDSISSLLAD